ncbi:hypothetical protein TON_1038 [Thermococcus onnurineus NA1]|uniref:Uncharacterized protein n=1 Tax=Thermococcus onnurineus (strain NA1) TaxID=523850 RepID=B6YWR3_THEON|nr:MULTISPECIES: hypothetical protein [Thermococcus]ACJ16526.1 hypothetical protein TON_1038 [Thermococcus onnurineus NA1]NJE47815.1 hypothetical protein [Thermococcus sp. GR7]NJE79551.1 hypothetical protein [Thermococcus sp. GR4]NJF23424.1 hypothetical protein [Thermococcus sp. GR5]
MESKTARVPFSGGWEALISVAVNPEELFPTFPYRAEVTKTEERLIAKLSIKSFLWKFEFEGALELAFNEPHVTYVMKGRKGLLILSFMADNRNLLARASADIPGEKLLGKKLRLIAEGSGKTLARMAESHHIVAPLVFGSAREFILKEFRAPLLAHLLRYVMLKTGRRSFRIIGEAGDSRFVAEVLGGVIEKVEYETASGSSIIEVRKSILDVSEDDFTGMELAGRYMVKIEEH